MHAQWTDQFSAYLDGELLEAERSQLEQHLAACADCRRVLEELRAVVQWAPTFVGLEPAHELWPAVARGIEADRDRPLRRPSFSWQQLIAASVIVACLSGGGVWYAVRGGVGEVRVVGVVDTTQPATPFVPTALAMPPARSAAAYDAAVLDLARALEQGKGRLRPQTREVIERNLRVIDRAIVESQRALAADPGNAFLADDVTANMRRKLNLLRQATRAIGSES